MIVFMFSFLTIVPDTRGASLLPTTILNLWHHISKWQRDEDNIQTVVGTLFSNSSGQNVVCTSGAEREREASGVHVHVSAGLWDDISKNHSEVFSSWFWPAWGSQRWAGEKRIGWRPRVRSPSWSGLAAAETKDKQDEDGQTAAGSHHTSVELHRSLSLTCVVCK